MCLFYNEALPSSDFSLISKINYSLVFSIDLILPDALWTWVRHIQKWVPWIFLEVKSGRRLRPHRHLWADCLENVEASTSAACYKENFTFTFTTKSVFLESEQSYPYQSNNLDFCLGGLRFEFWPGHQPFWHNIFLIFPIPSETNSGAKPRLIHNIFLPIIDQSSYHSKLCILGCWKHRKINNICM
jgi:hypothetical protein